ncbi:MAG: DUF11 domain-containing protein [Theionarchaea archaeon]|nr:DUF11 domain-containing protein [Theionarchaea archaeon]
MAKSMKRLGSIVLIGLSLFFNVYYIGSQPVLAVDIVGTASVNMCQQYDYTITIENTSSSESATNVTVLATIPADFTIVDGGGGTVVGQTITWGAGDLPPLDSWNAVISLYVTCAAVSGQILVDVTHDAGSSQGSIYLTVQPGAVTITKTPSVIPAHLNDTVHWTLTVTSTGFGPIQNVRVQDTLGAGLLFDAVQSTSGDTSGLPTVTWDYSYIPALQLMKPGDQVLIDVYAEVIACSGLENDAQAVWSCNGTPCQTETTQASVQLIVEEPEISYVLPDFQLDYCSAGTQFTIPITNSGTGAAHSFYLYVDFGPLFVTVLGPAGASYDSVFDRFFIGDIPAGSTVNLMFTLTHSDWCSGLPSQRILFQPEYYDDCGEVFYPPVQYGNLSVTSVPSLTLSKTGAPPEIYLGESITYTIAAAYSGPLSCGGGNAGNITVVDTIPGGFTIVDAGGGTVVGSTITWVVAATAGLNTTITLQSPNYSQCELYCYTYATNTVTASMTDCCGCTLTASSSQTTALECEEYYDSEKAVSSTTGFEKCTDIYYTNTYQFYDDVWWDDVSWTDLVFYEDMANFQTYVAGSLSVTVDDGVNTCSIVIAPNIVGGQLVLDFSTGDYSSCVPFPAVRNSTLTIQYTLQTTDASSPGCCEPTYSFYDWSVLDTGKQGGSCQPDQELQETVYVTINQAQMNISINTIPDFISSCESCNVSIDVTRTSAVGAYDVLVVVPIQNYAVTVTGYTGPVPTLTTYADRLEFDYGDSFVTQVAAQILVTFQKRCGTPADNSASVYWDGKCWDDAQPDRECSHTVAGCPYLLEASLFIKKTPELIYATQNQVTWTIYVTNSGSGTAYSVWVDDILGSDLQYNSSSATDLLGNPVPVTITVNQDHLGTPINGVNWSFNEIPAGETRVITLTADLVGCTNLDNDVAASWGCLGVDCQPAVTDHSTVAIPPAYAVTTNILPAYINLCEQDTITVQVKNAGLTTIYNVEVRVTLPLGLDYVAGTGVPGEPQDPLANPLVWTSTEAAFLSSIDPGVTRSISFDVIAGCDFPNGNRTVVSEAYYESVCRELKISPESRSTLPVREPTISIVKDGRNVTAGQASYTNTVNAEPGDLIEWRIRISNTGASTAYNVEFWDVFPSNMTFSSVTPAPPGGGSGTQADPWVHGDLLVGQTVTYSVYATVDAGECTASPTTNTACVHYGCNDNPTTPAVDPCREPQSCDTGYLRTTSSFTISQTLGTITTCNGEITVTVRNNGPTAYNVVITSDLPAGFYYDSMVSGPSPSPEPPADLTRPIWVIGPMTEGQTVVLQFRIIDDGTSCGTVTPDVNTVYVDFDNACDQHYTRTNTRNVTPLTPVLTVSKTPEIVTRPPGGSTTWTITVTNTGNYQAESVDVVDSLSLNFINIAAGNGSGGEIPAVVGNTVTWNVSAPIPIGGTWTATLSADITGTLGTDTVVVNGYCSTGCVYSTATDTAWVQTVEGIFKTPDVQTATIGEEITFDVSISYWGASSYENVLVIDTLPAGLEYVSSTYNDTLGLSPVPVVVGQSITWTLGNFTGPNTVDITVTARVQDVVTNQDGVTLTNWARSTGTEEGVPFDLSDDADVEIIEPDLIINKQGSITEGLPGDTIHYTITIQNQGTSPAYDVSIEDVVPTGLILDTGSIASTPQATATSVVGNTVTWSYTIIPVGSTVILEYDAVIPPQGGVFTNVTTITDYSTLLGISPYERHYPPVDDEWTVRAPGTDLMKITLNTQINVPSPGGIVYFELTIENTGDMILDPVQLTDILPDGLTYRPGTAIVAGLPYEPDFTVDNSDRTQTLTWLNIGAMNPSDIITVSFEAEVDPGRVGTFVNRAIVIGTSVIGDVSDEDTSPVGVAAPAIHVVKSVAPSSLNPGQNVTFTLTITNTGEVPLDPVKVVDVLSLGLTYQDAANISPDQTVVDPDSTMTLIWANVGPLDTGETITITFEAYVNGEESPALNVVTATGTPPNGFPVSDDDSALVTLPTGTIHRTQVSLQPLAYGGMMDCYARYKELIEKIRDSGVDVEWRREAPCCENLEDLIKQLLNLVLDKGLDKKYPEKWARVQELLSRIELCCKQLEEYYYAGNYIASNYWSNQRDNNYEELVDLLLEILKEG